MGKTKKILSFLIALIMVLALVPFNSIVYAVDVETGDEAQTQAPSVKEPTKQEVEPVENADLEIGTADELKAFAAAVNAGNSFEGKVVVLTADIDLEYTAVVIGTKDNSFKGTFDGQNYTVSNLYIYEDGSESDYFADSDDCLGLFGVINTPAVVKNVTVDNPYIIGGAYVAGIVGMAYTGAISNCHVTGEIDIEGCYMVGGITGHGYAKIENCSVIGDYDWDYNYIGATYNKADVEGDNVGGIVGHKAENTTITGCTVANVTVEGTRKVGGIVGTTFQNNTITDCKVINVVVGTNATKEYANANLSSMGLGGIIGVTSGSYNGGTVADCVVDGLSFTNENNVPVSQGAITGGHRQTSGQLPVAPADTTFVGNTAGNVVGANNEFVECGELKPELPTATVTPIVNDSNVLFGLTFNADTITPEQLEAYGDWYADFTIEFNVGEGSTLDKIVLGTGEGADGWLSGQYDEWSESWVNVPFENVEIPLGEPIKVMDFAAKLMGQDGLKITYREVYELVKEFNCGVYLTPEFVSENPEFNVDIGLSMFEEVTNADGTVTEREVKVECTDKQDNPMQTTFTSEDISLELPSAKVTPVINPDLSFGLTFEVNEITDAQLDYYGDWYADFTIEFNVGEGSTLDKIVLGAGEGADGWLSGQYDAWSENWVNVPFENEEIPLGESIKVMDFAAKLMGQDGLKITYREVYEGVKKFNCGVYLTPEFVEEYGEFTVAVDLAMFEPVVDENGNVTEKKHTVVYTDAEGNVIDKAEVTLFDKSDIVVWAAEVNGVKYATVQEAINAAQADDVIVILKDVELDTPIVVAAGKELTIDLNGKTISYTSTVQGEAMITNKGNLTINDSVGSGVINYNYVGAADSTFSKGNYTISNAGTLVVNGGKITIANLRAHAKYPIDNNSTSGDAILIINGGHLYNYNTSAIRQFCNSTTYKNSVTINGGLIEGYNAIWVQNPSQTSTVNGQLTIAGGEIRTTAKAYVEGTAAIKDVASSVYCTTEGGAWSADSSVAITGGTINENVDLSEEAPAKINVDEEKATFNGNLELPKKDVAQIGDKKYTSLQAAIDAAQAGDTILVLEDIVLEDTVTVAYGKTVTLDLNGKTISQTKAQAGNYQMIMNDGNLTIQDSIGGGKISYTDTVGGNFISNTITNRGTLTLLSGRVENMSSAAVANAGFPYAIDTSIWGAAGEVVINIKGGTVYCESYSALRLRADSETEAVNINISGGEIYGRIEVQNPTSNKATVGKLTITNGIINKNNSSKAIMIFGGGGTATNMKMEITGGEFVGVIGYSNSFSIADFDEKSISGGTFDTDVSAFCAEGFVCVDNGDGTYGVAKKELESLGIYTASLVASGTLQMNIYLDPANAYRNGDAYYMVITLAGEEVVRVNKADWSKDQYGNYFVPVTVPAKSMADVISAQLYDADGNAISEVYNDSVEYYARYVLQNSLFSVEMRAALVAMLNYGAETQKVFGYKTDKLANANISAYQYLVEDIDNTMDGSDLVVDYVNDKVFNQHSIDAASSLVLNLYYDNTFAGGEKIICEANRNSLKVTITYTNYQGQSITEVIEGAALNIDGEVLKVAATGLAASDIETVITVTVEYNGVVVSELTDSVEAYCAKAAAYNASLKAACEAIVVYGRATRAYFASIK